jgi:nucleoside triphosphate pyrophosphatase
MLLKRLDNYEIILASQSPRRRYLLTELGIKFRTSDLHVVDENYPSGLSKTEIPVFLSELKSDNYADNLTENQILITADTIVWFENNVINKPVDRLDAINILKSLQGNMHEVVTGVTLRSSRKKHSFYSHSEVYFASLSEEEIIYYVDKYNPLDKAGAYGIQEWIGYAGIKEIKGSYFNVMGLPVQKLYNELNNFINI